MLSRHSEAARAAHVLAPSRYVCHSWQGELNLFRGATGEQLKVPLHSRQYGHLALPFFPLETHHLIVEKASRERASMLVAEP